MTKLAKVEESLEGATLEGLYRVGPVLREGGMGTVHAALQTRLNKRVAIKVMAHELAGDAEALLRFRREAEIASAIGHPHIVQILDFGTTPAGAPFLVMELLEGEDLETRLERVGRLSPPEMLHIVKQVASALAAVHANGIVHRDLKPANIFLLDVAGEFDFVKVLDFGVSKIATARTGLTGNTKVLGTPRYMSREQAQGLVHQIDERTDEWALACIAWEAISGQPPFVGDDSISLLYQVVHETPAPLVNHFPDGFAIEQVLRRALAKDKGERFAHVTDFASALEKAVMETAPGTPARACRIPRQTSRMAAGQQRGYPSVSVLGVTARRTGNESNPRNLATTLRARPGTVASPASPGPAQPRRRHRLRWLWSIAAALVGAVIADMPAKQPADATVEASAPVPVAPPGPAAATPIAPREVPLVADTQARAGRAPVVAVPASPSSATGPSAPSPADDPSECAPAPAASKERVRSRARGVSGAAVGSAERARRTPAPSAENPRPRTPLEGRLIREL